MFSGVFGPKWLEFKAFWARSDRIGCPHGLNVKAHGTFWLHGDNFVWYWTCGDHILVITDILSQYRIVSDRCTEWFTVFADRSGIYTFFILQYTPRRSQTCESLFDFLSNRSAIDQGRFGPTKFVFLFDQFRANLAAFCNAFLCLPYRLCSICHISFSYTMYCSLHPTFWLLGVIGPVS